VYETGSKDDDAHAQTPVIRPLQLRQGKDEAGDEHALPAFSVSTSHKMKGHRNP